MDENLIEKENEEELEQMKKLPIQDQIEYLLFKTQAHEDILKYELEVFIDFLSGKSRGSKS